MYTQCPECSTVFRVTATVLRAAHGQVRCGVCDATFDALQFLSEEVDGEGLAVTARDDDADAPDAGGPDTGRYAGAPADDHDEFEDGDDADEPEDAEYADDAAAREYADDAETPEHADDAETPEHVDEADPGYAPAATGADTDRDPDDPIVASSADVEPHVHPERHGDDAAPSPRRVVRYGDAGPVEDGDLDAPGPGDDRARGARGILRDDDGDDLRETIASDDAIPLPRPPAERSPWRDDPPRTFAPRGEASGASEPWRTAPRGSHEPASGDDERRLGEIAAALARDANRPRVPAGTADQELELAAFDLDILDPADAENIVLGGEVPDEALEFDLPAEEWDRVFVPDREAPTVPPLDPELARARAEALAPARLPAASKDADDERDERDGDYEHEIDLDEDLPVAEEIVLSSGDDPLARTDEFPPLRLTSEQEAELGLAADDEPRLRRPDAGSQRPGLGAAAEPAAGTSTGRARGDWGPAAPATTRDAGGQAATARPTGAGPMRPEPGAERGAAPAASGRSAPDRVGSAAVAAARSTPNARPPAQAPADSPAVTAQDFDALVAAAAARAAQQVAATRVVVVQAPGPAPAPLAPPLSSAVAPTPVAPSAPLPPPTAAREPLTLDGTALGATVREVAPDSGWFDARRDLAREGGLRADGVQLDPSRFQLSGARRRRGTPLGNAVLGAAAALLALGLVAQVVDHWRDALAQQPVIGPPLAELYARLGTPIEPRWNVAAYELKQWGAGAAADPGTLRVRASVVNRAARGQPYPLLRVTLEDRFGGKVARREFAPAEYLPGRTAPEALLPPGARADADLLVADPGAEAVGFELDVCLRREGRLTCGNDLRLAVRP